MNMPGAAGHWQPPPFAFPNLPDALCAQVDPELFYPDKGETARPAKRICRNCYEQTNCLQWALDHDETFGIWGGTTRQQRKKLQRERDAA